MMEQLALDWPGIWESLLITGAVVVIVSTCIGFMFVIDYLIRPLVKQFVELVEYIVWHKPDNIPDSEDQISNNGK